MASGTYYATQNFPFCTVELCGGEFVVASGCSSEGGSCFGNQLLRLQGEGGSGLVSNAGYCGSCAQISYTVPLGTACQNYTIAQGCDYFYSCSGTTAVRISSADAAATGEASTTRVYGICKLRTLKTNFNCSRASDLLVLYMR